MTWRFGWHVFRPVGEVRAGGPPVPGWAPGPHPAHPTTDSTVSAEYVGFTVGGHRDDGGSFIGCYGSDDSFPRWSGGGRFEVGRSYRVPFSAYQRVRWHA